MRTATAPHIAFVLATLTILPARSQTGVPLGVIAADVPAAGASLAQGWDFGRENVTPSKCVTGTVSAPAAQTVEISIGQFADNSTLASAFNLSTSAQASFLVGKADARAKFVLDQKSSYENFSLAVRGSVRQTKSLLPGGTGTPTTAAVASIIPASPKLLHLFGPPKPQIHPDAISGSIQLTASARALASSNLTAFHNQCGDAFIVGITSGADIIGFVTTQASSNQDQQSLVASLKGSVLGQSAQADVDKTIQVLAGRQNSSLSFQQFGGAGAPGAVDANGLIQSLQQLPKTAANGPEDFQVLLEIYGPTTVANWPAGPLGAPARTPLDTIMDLYWRYKALYDEADQIQTNQGAYVLGWGIDATTLANVKTEALKSTQDLEHAADDCLGGKPCQIPPVDPDIYRLSVQLPLPHNWNVEEQQLRNAYNVAAADVANFNTQADQQYNYYNGLGWDDNSGYKRNMAYTQNFSEPYWPSTMAPAFAALQNASNSFAAALKRDLTDLRIRNIVRLRCQISTLDPGCISETQIDQYVASISIQTHLPSTNFTAPAPGNNIYPMFGRTRATFSFAL